MLRTPVSLSAGAVGLGPSVTHMPLAPASLCDAKCRGQRRPAGGERREVRHFLFPADLKPGGAGTYKLAREWDTRGERFGSDNGLFFICIARRATPAVFLLRHGDSFINTGVGAGGGNACRRTSWGDGGVAARMGAKGSAARTNGPTPLW